MADYLNYSLSVNGVACEVQIEGLSQSSKESAGATVTGSASPVHTARAFSAPSPVFAAPTQAAWVTARRVAHLPFH